MNKIILHASIHAPIERCFDLASSIDLHKISASKSQEEAIDGVTEGFIKLNETVTRPNSFVDEMLEGSFKFMKHRHEFKREEDKTIMIDTFEFASPLGPLGKLVDKLFLENYMRNFLVERNEVIKDFAESDKWKQVL